MEFDDARRAKWRLGREERELLDSDGFQGNAAYEIQEEMLDVANYADQLRHEGRITDEEQKRVVDLAFEFWKWAGHV